MKLCISLIAIFISSSAIAGYPESIASFSLVGRHASDSKNAARVHKIDVHKVSSKDIKKCRAYLLWCGTSGVINSPKKICDLARKSNLETIKAGGYGTEGFGYGASTSWNFVEKNTIETEIRINLGWLSRRLISLKLKIDGSGKYFVAKDMKANFFKMVKNGKGTWEHNKHYSPSSFERETSFFDLALNCKP